MRLFSGSSSEKSGSERVQLECSNRLRRLCERVVYVMLFGLLSVSVLFCTTYFGGLAFSKGNLDIILFAPLLLFLLIKIISITALIFSSVMVVILKVYLQPVSKVALVLCVLSILILYICNTFFNFYV